MDSLLLTTFPEYSWSIGTGAVMIFGNIVAIMAGRFGIQQAGTAGPALPGNDFTKNFGVPELLATTAFGHILGAGMILGLRAGGAL